MNIVTKLIAVLVIFFLFNIQLSVFKSYQTLFPTSDENENNYFDDSEIEKSTKDEDQASFVEEDEPKYGEEQVQSKASEPYKPRTNIIENEIVEFNSNSQKQEPVSSLNTLTATSKPSINLNTLNESQLILIDKTPLDGMPNQRPTAEPVFDTVAQDNQKILH